MSMTENPVSEAAAQEITRRVAVSHLQEGLVLTNEEQKNLTCYLMGRMSFQELRQLAVKGM